MPPRPAHSAPSGLLRCGGRIAPVRASTRSTRGSLEAGLLAAASTLGGKARCPLTRATHMAVRLLDFPGQLHASAGGYLRAACVGRSLQASFRGDEGA